MKKIFLNTIVITIMVGAILTYLSQQTNAELEDSASNEEIVIKPIMIEEVDGEKYFAFTSDDEGLYFTQEDILTDGLEYEVGDVAYAYYEKDPEGRENNFIAVMDY